MAFENLAVNITADTADATSSIRSVKGATEGLGDEARDLNISLERLGGTLNDAGNEAALAGVKAGGASAGFTSLAISTSGASLAIGTFSSTVTLALLPALAAAATLLAPLTAGLTALAAFGGGALLGAGAVLGTGAIAGLQRLRAALSETLAELRAIATEVGAPFVDLLLAGIEFLPTLAREVVNAAGSLEPFAEFLGFLGRTAADVIPDIARRLFSLGREALPVIRRAVDTIVSTGGGVFDALLSSARELAPEFFNFLSALGRVDGGILSFGTSLANTLLPALTSLINKTLKFANSKAFAEMLTAFREAVGRKGFQQTLKAFSNNIGKIFEALKENGPGIIRGFVAALDSVLDIVNALTPLVTGLIEALGFLGGGFADFTARSERRERQIAAERANTTTPGPNPVNQQIAAGVEDTAQRQGAPPGLIDAVQQGLEAAGVQIDLDGQTLNDQLDRQDQRYGQYRGSAE